MYEIQGSGSRRDGACRSHDPEGARRAQIPRKRARPVRLGKARGQSDRVRRQKARRARTQRAKYKERRRQVCAVFRRQRRVRKIRTRVRRIRRRCDRQFELLAHGRTRAARRARGQSRSGVQAQRDYSKPQLLDHSSRRGVKAVARPL